jgi:hypothetical protein
MSAGCWSDGVCGLEGMMPAFAAPCNVLASQPMTPTQSAWSEMDLGEVPPPGAQTTQRNNP